MGDIKKVIVWGISSLLASMAFLIVYLWQHPHV
jgi:hypothetical protein